MQQKSPHVSVIVPNYNYSPYLHQRIKSILTQSYQDFELILLDDSSTDDSAEILKSYANDPHVSAVIINEHNSGGVFHQWEKGIDTAKGDLIWIAEADDYAEPTFLEKCVTTLDNNKDVVLCQTGANIVDSEGERTRQNWDLWSYTSHDVCILDGNRFVYRILRYRNAIYNASGVVFRRGDYGATLAEACGYRACGDWLFWIDLARSGKCAIIKEKLNNFRRHATSASANSDINVGEDIKLFDALISRGVFTPSIFSHGFITNVGILRRKIKHVADSRKQILYSKQLNKTSSIPYTWPYYYSQVCKLLSHLPWLCPHPWLRKI